MEELFEDFKKYYKELLDLKETDKFKRFGFAITGYNDWLKEVDVLIKHKGNKAMYKKKGVLMGDLMQLGYAYVYSESLENDKTDYYNTLFIKAIG